MDWKYRNRNYDFIDFNDFVWIVSTCHVYVSFSMFDSVFEWLQMLFVAILGQYTTKDYMESKQRPIYIIKETSKNLS